VSAVTIVLTFQQRV